MSQAGHKTKSKVKTIAFLPLQMCSQLNKYLPSHCVISPMLVVSTVRSLPDLYVVSRAPPHSLHCIHCIVCPSTDPYHTQNSYPTSGTCKSLPVSLLSATALGSPSFPKDVCLTFRTTDGFDHLSRFCCIYLLLFVDRKWNSILQNKAHTWPLVPFRFLTKNRNVRRATI